ncbi:hypothetical protein RKD49_006696 [Streptomyces glaucescens]
MTPAGKRPDGDGPRRRAGAARRTDGAGLARPHRRAGLCENTTDHNAPIGGTATGEVVRDPYPGRVRFVDVRPLSAGRFAADAPRPEANVV